MNGPKRIRRYRIEIWGIIMNPGTRRGFSKNIKTWNDVQWHKVEERVSKYQYRIFRKSARLNAMHKDGKKVTKRELGALHQLQRHLLRSPDAKLLAVRKVSQLNKGAKTPGVDKVAKLSRQERLELAKSLDLSFTPLPIRGVDIPKESGKTRSLGIPAMRDRATQALVHMVLEPEWEARFESNSYGFRPGRSCHDATSAVWHSLKGKSKYVLDADISGCFDNISHDLLLEKLQTTREIRTIVGKWLKSARVKGFFPKTSYELIESNRRGTPQGGVISPLLANIALHGMEDAIREYYVNELYPIYGHTASTQKPSSISIKDRERQITVIRYADDFVIIHPSREVIAACKIYVAKWLKENVGLELSEEKTSIIQSGNGFNFLGFHFISITEKESGKTKCRTSVSRKAKEKLIKKTNELLFKKGRSWSQELVIQKLNPIIVGWCNYYSMHECSTDFKQVEGRVFKQLQKWCLRRGAPGLQGNKLIESYFKKAEVKFRGALHKGIQFCCTVKDRTGKKDSTLFWVKPSFITSRRHIKVQGNKSPYDGDTTYWMNRNSRYYPIKPSWKPIYLRQKGLCPLCNQGFKPFSIEQIERDHIIPISQGGDDSITNIQLVHRSCHERKSAKEQSSKTK